jgi:hypothetical protein
MALAWMPTSLFCELLLPLALACTRLARWRSLLCELLPPLALALALALDPNRRPRGKRWR